ncbi:antigen WC1.1-like [Muntiacus reevesi]|uniref:antigen WC1.1-like n=1 Tax=Muntiacus reevesi TaxID=9886 RepID=UPI003306A1D3
MVLSRHLSFQGLCVLLLGTVVGGQALELRLINGDHSCEGRVEVKHQGKWGTVNDLNWSMEEAHVVCRQLRCGAAVDAPKGSKFGPGIGPVWFRYIYCKGQESVITECSYPPLKDHRTEGSSHNKDAGAICSAREVRLKDGAHSCEGRVEVKHQGKWGTVNDQNWSLEAAAVVCRELKCGAAINASRGAHFGPGIGPIWFQYIYCNGTESSLMECSYPPLKNYLSEGLSHDGDAGAVYSALEVRLKDGGHRCEGRVEVKHQGEWDTVNDHSWSLEEAQVVCRQLGCGAAIDAPGGAYFGPGIGPIWFHSTNCKGTESVLTVCGYPSLKDHRPEGLSHDQDAGAVCSDLELRLMDGDHPCEGRVEVKHQGAWGTVNDYNWNMEEAHVVCRQLRCGAAVHAPKGSKFGPGIGPIWFHYIYCKGQESAINECSYPVVMDHHPEGHSHNKDAGAVCSALEVRLKDGAHHCEGRVEVKHQGEWGTVNDQNWSLEEAQVVCRQLKCGAATDAPRGAYLGSGTGPIWFQYIYCNGTESLPTQCSYPPLKDHRPEGLSHDGDAGAVCSDHNVAAGFIRAGERARKLWR